MIRSMREAIAVFGRVVASVIWPEAFDEVKQAVAVATGLALNVIRDTVVRIQPPAPSLWTSEIDMLLAAEFARYDIVLTRQGLARGADGAPRYRVRLNDGEGFYCVDDVRRLWQGWDREPWTLSRVEYIERRIGALLAALPSASPPTQLAWRQDALRQTVALDHFFLVWNALRAQRKVEACLVDYPFPDYVLGPRQLEYTREYLERLRRCHAEKLAQLEQQAGLPEQGTLLQGTLDHVAAWSDGHVIFKGSPPEGRSPQPFPADFARYLDTLPRGTTPPVEAIPIGVVPWGADLPYDLVALSTPDGSHFTTLQLGYFAYAESHFPGAAYKFNPQCEDGPIEIWRDTERQGAIMPFRPTGQVREFVREQMGLPLDKSPLNSQRLAIPY